MAERHRTPRELASNRWVVGGFGIALAVLLAACQPITYDFDAQMTSSSNAQWRVQPVTLASGIGVEVRIRDCNTVQMVYETDHSYDAALHLRPWAHVHDAKGTVLYDSSPGHGPGVIPSGSSEVDDPSDAGVDRIRIPVKGAAAPLTVTAGCTNYYGQGGGYTWTFNGCTTSTRTCAARHSGSGDYKNPGE